jgi:EAL domain-containing protein (putative c-di-GMP-specific phosphodiesterase class I)
LLRLKEMGVDYAQGYLKHCPEPIDRLTEIAAKVGAAAS